MITIHTNEILKIVEGSYHIETLKTLMQNYPNISIGTDTWFNSFDK